MKITTLAALGAFGVSIAMMAPSVDAMPFGQTEMGAAGKSDVQQIHHKRRCANRWVNGYRKRVCWTLKHSSYNSGPTVWLHRHKHSWGWHKHRWTGAKAHGH